MIRTNHVVRKVDARAKDSDGRQGSGRLICRNGGLRLFPLPSHVCPESESYINMTHTQSALSSATP